MEIGFCPFFDGRNPKNFAFAADIKIPPSRRKDRSDAEEKVSKLFAAFMNDDVLPVLLPLRRRVRRDHA